MNIFAVVHEYDGGIDVIFLKTHRPMDDFEDNEGRITDEVIQKCAIDFEPDKGEVLHLIKVPSSIQDVTTTL